MGRKRCFSPSAKVYIISRFTYYSWKSSLPLSAFRAHPVLIEQFGHLRTLPRSRTVQEPLSALVVQVWILTVSYPHVIVPHILYVKFEMLITFYSLHFDFRIRINNKLSMSNDCPYNYYAAAAVVVDAGLLLNSHSFANIQYMSHNNFICFILILILTENYFLHLLQLVLNQKLHGY